MSKGSSKVWVSSILIVLGASFLAVWFQTQYFRSNPYFFDAASYSTYNLILFYKLQYTSRWDLVLFELFENARHPLRTLPLLIFLPQALSHPFGHLISAAPALFALVLGILLEARRIGRNHWGLFALLVLLGSPGFWNSTLGYPTYWLDLTAAIYFGAAAIFLRLYAVSLATKFLVAFSVLLSCSALSRINFGIIGSAAFAPFVAYSLLKKGKSAGKVASFKHFFLTSTLLLVGYGWFVFRHLEGTIRFYRLYGYNTNYALMTSLEDVSQDIVQFLSPIVYNFSIYSILAVWTLIIASLWVCRRQKDTLLFFYSLLFPYFFLVFYMNSANNIGIQSAIGLLFLLLFVYYTQIVFARFPHRKTAYTLLVVAIAYAGSNLAKHFQDISQDNPTVEKQFHISLVESVKSERRPFVWSMFFAEFAWLPNLIAAYDYGLVSIPAGQEYFNEHLSAWKADYPGLVVDQIVQKILRATDQNVDYAIVFKDPEAALDCTACFRNDYSRMIAASISRQLQQNSKWRKLEAKILPFRNLELIALKNQGPGSGHFERVLFRKPGWAPNQ